MWLHALPHALGKNKKKKLDLVASSCKADDDACEAEIMPSPHRGHPIYSLGHAHNSAVHGYAAELTSESDSLNGQWRRHGLLHSPSSPPGGVIGGIFYAGDTLTLTSQYLTVSATKQERDETRWRNLHRSTCIGMITARTCAGVFCSACSTNGSSCLDRTGGTHTEKSSRKRCIVS